MSDRRRRRFAVYLVTIAAGPKPQRPWSLPEVLTEGTLYAKNLLLVDAAGFVRTFNKRQLETGLTDGRWAVVARCPHYRSDAGADLERPVDEASAEARLAAIAARSHSFDLPKGGAQ